MNKTGSDGNALRRAARLRDRLLELKAPISYAASTPPARRPRKGRGRGKRGMSNNSY